ncbi:MAG: hypothetical protein LBK18_04565 [Prevotellaceae bacterium]|nr:hypothetical protein [Prevotellaceae bacterium]
MKIKEATAQYFSVAEIKSVSKPSEGFHVYKEFSNGGRIEIMNGYTKQPDYKDLIAIAHDLAKQGKIVQITTNRHFKSKEYWQVFGALGGTVYERKCPDLIVNGVFYEYERFEPPFKKEKISMMISHGVKQSSRIIIKNTKGSSDRYILRNIHNRIREKSFKLNIDEVWVYEKGKLRKLFSKK